MNTKINKLLCRQSDLKLSLQMWVRERLELRREPDKTMLSIYRSKSMKAILPL